MSWEIGSAREGAASALSIPSFSNRTTVRIASDIIAAVMSTRIWSLDPVIDDRIAWL
jgi:hypothetical protein